MLDKQRNDTPYLLGRLFAVLEDTQKIASNYTLNKTIRDSYFSSASARPAVVFPRIIQLNVNHLKNIKSFKLRNEREELIKEIIDKMGSSFPKTLSLVEQGEFYIGYYQQCLSINKKQNNEKENIKEEI